MNRPWYREPWPWVAILIPALAVVMGLTTLYLALANPEHLVVDDTEYRELKQDLSAQATEREVQDPPADDPDGEY